MRGSIRTEHLAAFLIGVAGVVGGIGAYGQQRNVAIAQQASPPAEFAAQGRGGDPAAAGLCVGCHSPVDGPLLSGVLTGRWLSPNITPDRVSGIGAWSREDLFRYLRHGKAPGRGQAGGPMAPVVEALQDSSDADLRALID